MFFTFINFFISHKSTYATFPHFVQFYVFFFLFVLTFLLIFTYSYLCTYCYLLFTYFLLYFNLILLISPYFSLFLLTQFISPKFIWIHQTYYCWPAECTLADGVFASWNDLPQILTISVPTHFAPIFDNQCTLADGVFGCWNDLPQILTISVITHSTPIFDNQCNYFISNTKAGQQSTKSNFYKWLEFKNWILSLLLRY